MRIALKSMSKRNKKNIQKQTVKLEHNNLSQEDMIEIQAEAVYRALKKFEQEKNDKIQSPTEKKHEKWYIKILFMLNMLFLPWKINKSFHINQGIYDSILVLFVAGALTLIGGVIWLFGVISIIYVCYQITIAGISSAIIVAFAIGTLLMLLGSMIILSSEEFSKEMDSHKIYAFSACIIALISCVVSVLSLFKM